MVKQRDFALLLSAVALFTEACVDVDDAPTDTDAAVLALEREIGGSAAVERGAMGTPRVLAMTPWLTVAGPPVGPAATAHKFLIDHHDVFGLTADEATGFIVLREDIDPESAIRHITLQRIYQVIPVFQGAITVHMDPQNRVARVIGDEFYRVSVPTNQRLLTPAEAAVAAGKALGRSIVPALDSRDGLRTTFTAEGAREPITVEPRIFQLAPGDSRFAFQVTLSWLDERREQHYELALVDAEDGSSLANFTLLNTFTGRVFTVSPGANPVADTRVLVSFNGNALASPAGWVDATRRTRGNNANAATDLNADNVVGGGEIQPIASAAPADAFDFPFSPLSNASLFREAAVTSAFFLVNDFHDRSYALGFTELAGNFQTSNFGRGGLQNDEVQVDAQDGAGLNNANFATPPDGLRPRMQMFQFTINGGATEDGDFDPTVIYHENGHGLSNRLVGGGSGGCLGGFQSGGMGEGWSDFMSATFLNNPIVGAYVTGNAATGIRRASMAASPFTYGSLQDKAVVGLVHDIGEIWAASLWTVRNTVGAALANRLVVLGMKLTPCSPTMLQARDAIIMADGFLTGGVNQCVLWNAFASRDMGIGAASANHNSLVDVVTSPSLPAACGGVNVVRRFNSAPLPLAIPDATPAGVNATINVPAGLNVLQVRVDVNITHTYRGDLQLQVFSPLGENFTLAVPNINDPADDFITTNQDISAAFTVGSAAAGPWRLFVSDNFGADIGQVNLFRLSITSTN